jgi:hypothetical protein
MNHDRIMTKAKKFNAIIPTQGSDTHRMLEAMFDGHKITVLTGPRLCGLTSVTQRANQLKRQGWPVKKRWLVVGKKKKKVMEYSL